jgi:Dimerisation domain
VAAKPDHSAVQALSEPPVIAPEPFYGFLEQVARGYKQVCALAAAVRLRLFDHLDEARQPADLAARLGADLQMIADLCDLLADTQLLNQLEDALRKSFLYVPKNDPRIKANSLLLNIS